MHAPTRAAPPQHARMAPTVQPAAWRLELFYSSLQQLEAQIPFLKRHGIARVNIPNKKPEDDLQGAIRLLRTHMPELDICCHFRCVIQHASAALVRGGTTPLGAPVPCWTSKKPGQ